MMTEEIIQKITEAGLTGRHFYNDDFDEASIGVGPIVLVKSYNNGDGRECGRIFFFEEHDIYLRITGVYSSWGDTYIEDNFEQVFQHRECIITYHTSPQSSSEYDHERSKFD